MKDYFIKKLVLSNHIGYRISRHILFWIIILLYSSGFLKPNSNFLDLLKYNLCFLPTDMISTYILIYLVYPIFLKGKIQNFITGFSYCILLLGLNFLISEYIQTYINNFYPIQDYPFITKILVSSRVLLIILFSASFIKTIKYWYETEINYRELEKKDTENKMILLSSQLQPHFLFNTLNNLYTLSLEKSEKLPDMIMGLSEIMRYITDDKRSKVELSKELEIINSYIAIEKIRYDDNLIVEKQINLSENQKKTIFIPPLLIFTFIENAFKHGVSKSINNPWISIKIGVLNSTLKIEVENSVDRLYEQKQKRQGIGLKNVKSRLNLYYPNKYKYSIRKTDIKYCVDVELNLQR